MLALQKLKEGFSKIIQSQSVQLHFLENNNGLKVGICNYGARITHFFVPDKGNTDIVLGFDNLEGYLNATERYHGVTVGPFANRINDAQFILDGITHQLEANNGKNSLHGGSSGFHNKIWDILEVERNTITLKVTNSDREGGFPGNLACQITFTLTNENELRMDYSAISDQNTVINLTNHAYFNLNGAGNGDILNHQVKIDADEFVEIDETCIPTGKLLKVADGAFDFRKPKPIGQDINIENDQLLMGNGYDHSFVLNKNENDFTFAATAKGDLTAITLEVYTTEPAMQFYTGNFLNDLDKGKMGKIYKARTGFCFETQHHPDSPNQPQFPSTFLAANQEFKSATVYKIILPE
ncbi:aldose epimerase family protein [Pedobacter cryophilus]|uniref:Aldose 1-epimerase n=1 Tax=Pedobacter cryophilus TaxID=2571271 RepID=A0A4V5NXN4_9SPHI|nr:aldose epimerase family protein [Pedobacter cryophilus]TKC00141.1 galactose mutarotase [Pedobacter cryophilus]